MHQFSFVQLYFVLYLALCPILSLLLSLLLHLIFSPSPMSAHRWDRVVSGGEDVLRGTHGEEQSGVRGLRIKYVRYIFLLMPVLALFLLTISSHLIASHCMSSHLIESHCITEGPLLLSFISFFVCQFRSLPSSVHHLWPTLTPYLSLSLPPFHHLCLGAETQFDNRGNLIRNGTGFIDRMACLFMSSAFIRTLLFVVVVGIIFTALPLPRHYQAVLT